MCMDMHFSAVPSAVIECPLLQVSHSPALTFVRLSRSGPVAPPVTAHSLSIGVTK